MRDRHFNLLGWVLLLVLCGTGGPIYAALGQDSVQSVQPMSLLHCGIRDLQQVRPELDGTGVLIASVCRSMTYENGLPRDDYRFNAFHQALRYGDIYFPDGSVQERGVSSHSTAIGGILIGSDPSGYHRDTGPFMYRGICPAASVDVYEFWRFVTLTVFGDQPLEADVLTLSLGVTFEDWWTRGIERLVEEQGLLTVASAGNGDQVHDPLLYPAAGANVLAVGVLDAAQDADGFYLADQFSLPRPARSSYGPTADLRCKPDLVAPGRAMVPTADNYQDYEIQGDYSSFAAPTAAGAAALLVQQIDNDPNLSERIGQTGRNCLLKAILMTSAQKLPWWHKGAVEAEDDHTAVLDWRQGAGALDAMRAWQVLTSASGADSGWDVSSIRRSDSSGRVYPIPIADPNQQILTVTLNWNRHYDDRYPYRPKTELDSDLRLEVWAVDPATPSEKILVDYSDSAYDNVEHLYTPLDGRYQDYELVVRFSDPALCPHENAEVYGVAWEVGPDHAAGHPSWYDLNNNGRQDPQDQIIYFSLEHNLQKTLSPHFLTGELGVEPEQAALLMSYWPQWRNYLPRWQSLYGEQALAAAEFEAQ